MFVATEGGYQNFVLSNSDWTWLWFAFATAIVALVVGVILTKRVLTVDAGTEKMREIAKAIQDGAMAYIMRQFKTIAVIVVPVGAIVFFTSKAIDKDSGLEALSFAQSGTFRTLAFVVGALCSGGIGFLGMWLSTRANVRTAHAATTGSMNKALGVAFKAGGVCGLFTALSSSSRTFCSSSSLGFRIFCGFDCVVNISSLTLERIYILYDMSLFRQERGL